MVFSSVAVKEDSADKTHYPGSTKGRGGGVTANESSLPAGRLAELPALPFAWHWHTALTPSTPAFDLVIKDLLRGTGSTPQC